MTLSETTAEGDDRDAGFGIIPRYLRGRLTAYEIAVYVALTWRADRNGECWIRHKRIAEEAGMSTATSRRTLDSLREKGLVTWMPKYDADGAVACNTYRIHVWTPSSAGAGVGSVGTTPMISVSSPPDLCERQNETPGTRPQEDPSSTAVDVIGEEFEGFWSHYPRRVGKKAALAAYRRARKDTDPALIAAGLCSQLADLEARDLDKVPHPTTWLNQRRWEDDPAHAAQPGDRPRQPVGLEGSDDGRYAKAILPGSGERIDW